MSTQNCYSSRAAEPMNVHRIGRSNSLASCSLCSHHCAYLTGDAGATCSMQSLQEQSGSNTQMVAALNSGSSMSCIAHACRFYTEEAYSFRVRSVIPNALQILDMQDMHSLRKGSPICSALLSRKSSDLVLPKHTCLPFKFFEHMFS